MNSSVASEAKQYLQNRQLTDNEIKHFGIGLMEIQQIPMVAITHTEIITTNQLILIIKKKKMFLKRVYLRHYCIRFCKCL